MTPQLGDTFRAMAKATEDAIEKAGEKTLQATLKLARTMSSGPYSLKQLADMDHPYAKRHKHPSLPPQIINKQKGRYRSDWKIEDGGVVNDNQVAVYLDEGTDKMIPRPIVEHLAAFAEADLAARLQKALAGVFGG